MPPLVCPRPGPRGPGRDCPLWGARARVQFQESIESDGASRRGLGAAVWFDMNRSYKRPGSLPTRPPLPVDPEPIAIEARPIAALITDEAMTAEPVEEKGARTHA